MVEGQLSVPADFGVWLPSLLGSGGGSWRLGTLALWSVAAYLPWTYAVLPVLALAWFTGG
jgi:hypothetical protein